MLKIAVLALPNCIHSSVTGPVDIFAVACLTWHQMSGADTPFCEVGIVLPGPQPVTAFNGLTLTSAVTIEDDRRYDIVIVPAMFGDLHPALTNSRLLAWLAGQHAAGTCICTVCAGSFLAAAAGLLKGRKATTHWALAADFRKRFPDVVLQAEKMVVDEGDIITAGGVTSYLDLCLYLVRRFGTAELAASLTRTFLIDPTRQAQLPYAVSSFPKNHGDTEIEKSQDWLEDHFTQPVTIADMAASAGLEERTFNRRFKKATGDAPSEYLRNLRLEAARRMLEQSRQTIDIVTRSVGYDDVSSFRRLFKSQTGLSPSAYRRKFSIFFEEQSPA